MMDLLDDDSGDINAMAVLRAKLKASKSLTPAANARRKREKDVKSAVDRQSFRARGRDEVFSFRCRQDLLEEIKTTSRQRGMSIAEWMEQIIEAALAMEKADERS